MSEVAFFFEKMHKVFKNKAQGCSTPLKSHIALGPTQRSVCQENAFKKSKKSSPRPSPFSRKTIIGSGTFSKVGGGGQIFEVENGDQTVAAQGMSEGGFAPLRSWSFFENVVLNGAIWCTIFHHVKHLTACLMGCLLLYNRIVIKWRGHAPTSLKSGGATAPGLLVLPPIRKL